MTTAAAKPQTTGNLLVLNAVRIWVHAIRRYRCPIGGLHHLFRLHSMVDGLRPFHSFLVNFCGSAGRRLDLRYVGCAQLSDDEQLILSAVSHFQQGNDAEAEQALMRIVPSYALHKTAAPLWTFSNQLAAAGLPVLCLDKGGPVTIH